MKKKTRFLSVLLMIYLGNIAQMTERYNEFMLMIIFRNLNSENEEKTYFSRESVKTTQIEWNKKLTEPYSNVNTGIIPENTSSRTCVFFYPVGHGF